MQSSKEKSTTMGEDTPDTGTDTDASAHTEKIKEEIEEDG